MDSKTWDSMTKAQRDCVRLPAQPEQLAPFRGDRVEVVAHCGETRRFWVGASTGWAPCYLEIHNSRSRGGSAADNAGYASIKLVRNGPR